MSTKLVPHKRIAGRVELFPDRLDVSTMTDGGMLFGAQAGHKVSRAAYRKLRSMPGGSVLLIDLSEVRQASHQALKEVLSIVEALRSRKLEERYLVFYVDTRNRDLVESIELLARIGGDIIPVVDRQGRRHSFGKLTKAERETLEAVEASGEVTSNDLRRRFGLLASAASNRLRRLNHLKLIKREERIVPGSGGREFVYRPLAGRGKPGR